MSAKMETIVEIKIVTDHDCGNYRIGEVDFLDLSLMHKYIRQHGEYGLMQIYDTCAKIMHSAKRTLADQDMLNNLTHQGECEIRQPYAHRAGDVK